MLKQTIPEILAISQCGLLGASYVCCRWGEPVELDRFLQAYAVERAKAVSRQQGYVATEQLLADGSIKLTVHVGGAA